MDSQLSEYIKLKLRSGVLPQDIKKILLEQGWQEQVVDGAISQIAQDPNAQFGSGNVLDNVPPIQYIKKSFFKRKLFKVLILLIGIIIVLLVGVDLTSGGLVRFGAKFGYYYIAESLSGKSATSTENNVQTLGQVQPPIFVHKTSLADLGINIPTIPGNGAEDFNNYFTVSYAEKEHGGEWNRKYGQLSEDQINLDPADEKVLLNLSTKEKFSFFPEIYPISNNPVSGWVIVYSPKDISTYARRVVVMARQLETNGNKLGSEKILQELILWGRKMENDKNSLLIQWLVGKRIEETATEALVGFYQRNSTSDKENIYKAYQQELADLQGKVPVITNIIHATLYPSMLSLIPDKSNRTFVRAAYKQLGINEKDFLSLLNSMNTDDTLIQNESLILLATLNTVKDLQPEQSIAESILERYQNSQSDNVRIEATYSLENPEKILNELKEVSPNPISQ